MKRIERTLLLAASLVGSGLLLSACGDGSSPSPDAAPPSDAAFLSEAALPMDTALPSDTTLPGALDTGEAAVGTDYCTSKPIAASVADISGTWAVRVTGAIVVNAPIIGVVHQQMVLTLLVDIDQQGTNVVADGRYCNRKQESAPGSLTQVIIPDAWAHTETPMNRPGTFAVSGDGVPVLVIPTMSETMGAVLASPLTDTLPATVDDPRVIDEDSDGNPGITVYLTGIALSGQLYAVQRQITSFAVIPVAADRLEGAVTFSTEQNVLGSNPPTLATLYAQAGQSGADPAPCSSTITMVKLTVAGVDGGAVTCDWVRANEPALFGP